MGKGGYGYKGKGKGKEEREALVRDADLDRRFNAPSSATSHNVNAFLLCLSFYLRKIIVPIEHILTTLPCVVQFGKFLSWIYRHNSQLLHEDLSLTLNELFWFPDFGKHINNGLSYIQHPSYAKNPHFGVIDCQEVSNECKKFNIQFESLRYFVPFVCVIWFNDKGRFSLSVQNETPTRLPTEEEWRTPPMSEAVMLDYLRHNGVIRGTNIFFRAQSGHTNIRETQRPGVEYDFRHNILMHKTTTANFENIKNSKALKVIGGRDIHFVPVEFLYHDPDMLRQYGERIILYNMHNEKTRKAFRTARETPNGYILVNEDIQLPQIEAVYALEKNNWEFPYSPVTDPRHNAAQGIDDAQALCSYFCKCYVSRNPTKFEDLEESLKGRVIAVGQHYEQNLRHTGDVPASVSAETPAQRAKQRKNKASMIDAVVQDLTSAVNDEAQKRIAAKAMPTTKKDPPPLPKDVPEARPAKIKPPPACAKVAEPKPPKLPPPHLRRPAEQNTDTTVKLEPRQPEGPPPPPPKRPDRPIPVKQEVKKPKMEETSGGPSSSSSRPPNPIPPPAPPSRTPQPPAYPPPSYGPAPPAYPPPNRQQFSCPTPPAPPNRAPIDVMSDFKRKMAQSDTTDANDDRIPLPRQRPEPPQEEERERDPIDHEFHDNVNLDAFIDVMNSIQHVIPDSTEARRQRAVVWDRLAYLAELGITTGSRMLDSMIQQGRDSIRISQHIYYSQFVPSPEEHFIRQDPGEAGTMIRPHLMLKIEDDEFNWDVLDALAELGRNCLAGRAVLRDHPKFFNAVEQHNVSTFYISIVVLNLGKINRMPWFAGRKRYGREIRDNPRFIKEKLVLPHVVLNNPGHIITLCESYDFVEYNELCIAYGTIGIQCISDKPDHAPPLSLFVKSPFGMIEVLHHWDLSKRTNSNTDGWLMHAVIFLVTFGPKSHDIHPVTRQRQEHRHTGESVDFYSIVAPERRNTHGITTVRTAEDDLDQLGTYDEIINYMDPPVRGYPESFVQRMGLAEYRVLCIHIDSFAFHNSLQRIREDLRLIFTKSIDGYGGFHLR